MEGCEAIAEAAVRVGCRFFAGYPITPQTEVPEYMSRRMPEVGGVFLQGESEIAAINMVYGAAATGTYAMTSSSSTGIALKTECISYLAAAHIPAVILNFQRGGPGIGNITASQSDYWQCVKGPGSGGHRCMVFSPSTLQECVDIMGTAFERSQRDRNPVIILLDGCIGNIREAVELPDMRPAPDIDASDWCLSGCEGRSPRQLLPYFRPDPKTCAEQACAMYERWQKEDVLVFEEALADAEVVLTSYGTAGRIVNSCARRLRDTGLRVGIIRPLTLNPFPAASFSGLDPAAVKLVIDVEMTKPAQMAEDVRLALNGRIPVKSLEIPSGVLPTDEDIYEGISAILQGEGIHGI